MKRIISVVILLLLVDLSARSVPQSTMDPGAVQAYVNNLFTYLAGAPRQTLDPVFGKVANLVGEGKFLDAAQVVTTDPNFINVRARSFALPFVDSAHQPQDTFTDLQALIVGVVRDELDARFLLTGNFRYSAYSSLGLPDVSRANNDHYAEIDAENLDLNTALEKIAPQWSDVSEAAGALTTRAWAAAYYKAGTNRLGVKFSLDAFLCTPIDMWKVAGIPDSFVRRDVVRDDGGNPAAFEHTCRNCHSTMDALGGAFAKVDFVNDEFIFQPSGVVSKMNKNNDKYPAGFVTTDDSWVNFLVEHPSIDFGWRNSSQGAGLANFAQLLANSKAFSRCMVQKTFNAVCGRSIKTAESDQLDPIADDFESKGYNLKYLFARVAAEDACISQPQ